MYKTFKARGIFWLILKIVTFWTRKRGLARRDKYKCEQKIWFIYNPFRRRVESLVPQELKTNGRLWKHEMLGHDGQRERLGLIRFIWVVIMNLMVCGYKNSPIEAEARLMEEK